LAAQGELANRNSGVFAGAESIGPFAQAAHGFSGMQGLRVRCVAGPQRNEVGHVASQGALGVGGIGQQGDDQVLKRNAPNALRSTSVSDWMLGGR